MGKAEKIFGICNMLGERKGEKEEFLGGSLRRKGTGTH